MRPFISLIFLFSLCDYYRSRTVAFVPRSLAPIKRHRCVYIVDPSSIDAIGNSPNVIENLQAGADAFESTFVKSLSARVIGGFLGNIAAGLVFTSLTVGISKVIGDKFNKGKAKEVNDVQVSTKTSPSSPNQISLGSWAKLLICIGIDLLGDASFAIPGVGEVEDVAWAPLSAFLLQQLFGSNIVSGFEFAKEILPGTDIIPVATLAWLLENVFVDSGISRALRLDQASKALKSIKDLKDSISESRKGDKE